MITFDEAFAKVMETSKSFGVVKVPLSKAVGRILAEPVLADRDFPPFDRATKDGIAIQFDEADPSVKYPVIGVAAAGTPQLTLDDGTSCFEIMTGAIVPKNANTVVMYEHISILDGMATVNEQVTLGQNIHIQGSDETKGTEVLKVGAQITAAEIGVLATVGKLEVLVQKNPKITLFSTGDELVPIENRPEPHQIRQSNSHTLKAALLELGIASEIVHVKDDRKQIYDALKTALSTSDILLMSGGVSKGKFDFLPEVLEKLGVKKKFHRVAQRPGKPFWFGEDQATNTKVFGFPGNPTSTFANFNLYFIPWLKHCWGIPFESIKVGISNPLENKLPLTVFERAWAYLEDGKLRADIVHGNGSGDLTSLVHANGFIRVPPETTIERNEELAFIPTRKIL